MVHGVAQNVPQGENLNNYKSVSEDLGRAKKNLWFNKTNHLFILSDTEECYFIHLLIMAV
jgi:hypothetical protein